jgi:hypothetical protein
MFLKSGSWCNARRVKAISLLCLIATAGSLLWIFWGAHGTLDAMNRPIGTDFSNVYSAGRMALDCRAALVWDWPTHFAEQQAIHQKTDVDFFGWHYPPPFLLLATLLATLPYVVALILWQLSSLAACLALVRAILPERKAMLVALACPLVLVCFGHGHNGFLTGFLLGGGLLLLERKPVLAGIMLGCLVYKPQFGLILPVVLIIGGHWRAIGGALLSAMILCSLTLMLWGWPVWQAFIDSLPLTQSVIIEQGSTGWEKIQSVFSATRNWGGDIALAWQVQSAFTVLAVAGAAFVVRGASPAVRNATILAASLLSTPYILDYDLVPLELGMAFLLSDGWRRGFLSWEKSLFAFVWFVPMLGRAVMAVSTIPLGLIAIIAIFALALRRAIILDGCTIAKSLPFRRLHGAFAR